MNFVVFENNETRKELNNEINRGWADYQWDIYNYSRNLEIATMAKILDDVRYKIFHLHFHDSLRCFYNPYIAPLALRNLSSYLYHTRTD